jgi:hypothetical protein
MEHRLGSLCHPKNPPQPPFRKVGSLTLRLEGGFEGAAVGAAPGVGEVFEFGAGGDVAHGVALGGVVDIAADGAAVFLHGGFPFLMNV